MYNEQNLIQRIHRGLTGAASRTPRGLVLGVGDDAAVLRRSRGREWVVSCDAFLEGVHFLASRHPPHSVGYKSLARATSDLAAIGARPQFFLMSLALPARRAGAWLEELLAGLRRAARTLGIVLAGGDTARYPRVVINITVIGEVQPGRAVTRSGARPGDGIYVTGRLGAAQVGLELVQSGRSGRPDLRRFLRPHLYPRIPLRLGQWLARQRIASAMIDISDGLSTDLTHLCRASGAGARIVAADIPTARMPSSLSGRGFDPLQMALHGGDDYELLFTVPTRLAKRLREAPDSQGITRIGEITRNRKILLVGANGRARPLAAMGWDPFQRRRG